MAFQSLWVLLPRRGAVVVELSLAWLPAVDSCDFGLASEMPFPWVVWEEWPSWTRAGYVEFI